METLITLSVIFAILLFIALIRVGAKVRYSEDGFLVIARVFAFSFTVFPRPEKDGKAKKKKEPKQKQEKPKEKKKGGTVELLRKVLEAAKKVLGRLKRKLRIDELTLHYVSGCDDPCDAAIKFGMASAGAGTIIPFLKNNFKLKRYDITTDVDFSGAGDRIYLELQLSLAIWEVIYIALGLIVLLKGNGKKHDSINTNDRSAERKVDNDGKTPVK